MSESVMAVKSRCQYSGAGVRGIFFVLGMPHLYVGLKNLQHPIQWMRQQLQDCAKNVLTAISGKMLSILF